MSIPILKSWFLDEDSVVSIGIGDSAFQLNKHVGKFKDSTGYLSRDGKIFYNEMAIASSSLTEGERYSEGKKCECERYLGRPWHGTVR